MPNLKSSVRAYQAFARHNGVTLVVTSQRRSYGLVDPDGVFTSRHVCRGIVQQIDLLTSHADRSKADRLATVLTVRGDREFLNGLPYTAAEDVEWRD